MNIKTKNQAPILILPKTQVYKNPDDNLFIFYRSWGSNEYDRVFVEEILHFLSSAQADVDLTSPFPNKPYLSSLANKIRTSLLFANAHIYGVENKTEYQVGFEGFVLVKSKLELAWGCSGNFKLQKIFKSHAQTILERTSEWENQVSLPPTLLGVMNEPDLTCGSLRVQEDTRLLLSSSIMGEIKITGFEGEELSLSGTSEQTCFWSALLEKI